MNGVPRRPLHGVPVALVALMLAAAQCACASAPAMPVAAARSARRLAPEHTGRWNAQVVVGNRVYSATVDAQAAVNAFPCEGCEDCEAEDALNVTASITATPVMCGDAVCTYSDGNITGTVWVEEARFLRDSSSSQSLRFVCATSGAPQGIISLANGPQSYLAQLYASTLVERDAIELCSTESGAINWLSFGMEQAFPTTAPIVSTPLLDGIGWAVNCSGLSVGRDGDESAIDMPLPLPVRFATAQEASLLPPSLVTAVLDALVASCASCRRAEADSDCVWASPPTFSSNAITFTFPSAPAASAPAAEASLHASLQHVMACERQDTGRELCCLRRGEEGGIVLGAGALTWQAIQLDAERRTIAMAPWQCDGSAVACACDSTLLASSDACLCCPCDSETRAESPGCVCCGCDLQLPASSCPAQCDTAPVIGGDSGAAGNNSCACMPWLDASNQACLCERCPCGAANWTSEPACVCPHACQCNAALLPNDVGCDCCPCQPTQLRNSSCLCGRCACQPSLPMDAEACICSRCRCNATLWSNDAHCRCSVFGSNLKQPAMSPMLWAAVGSGVLVLGAIVFLLVMWRRRSTRVYVEVGSDDSSWADGSAPAPSAPSAPSELELFSLT